MDLQAEPLALVALGVAVLALLLLIVVQVRQSRLLKRYRSLLRTPAGTDLEGLILAHGDGITRLAERVTGLEHQAEQMVSDALAHVQKVGVVRFNAFPDAGSDLSFAVALLDATNTGVLFSSIYTRSESRVYAKPVVKGASTYHLTDEEKQALARAQVQK